MPDLAIIAALPRELAPLARDLRATLVSNAGGVLLQSAPLGGGRGSVLLATAGMGAPRVALAVAAALAHGPIGTLLSIGFAGACDPALRPGAVIEASLVVDIRSGERFSTDGIFAVAPPGVLITSAQIAGVPEKRRLRESYNAAAVDMEAATVARLARAYGIPFAALKAISDEHDVDLSHLSAFSDDRGHFRTSAFALHTLLRPQLWLPTMRLGRNSSTAVAALTSAVQQAIARYSPGAVQ